MIKINSISGVVCFVSDLNKTAEFYETLGFRPGDRTSENFKVYVNWFWIEFVLSDKAEKSVFQKENDTDGANNGGGLFLHISVGNVDEFYEAIVAKGVKPSSEPKDFPWGRREFVVRDPDGYKLVFFAKK